MIEDSLQPDEKLFRGIPNSDGHWVTKENRPSSSFWKDKKGPSVDRQADRSDNDCRQALMRRKNKFKGVVTITFQDCIDLDIHVHPDPIQESENIEANPYHMILMRDQETRQLSGLQAKKLLDRTVVNYLREEYR